jgi:molybdenum cofactor cytidylyltransferase
MSEFASTGNVAAVILAAGSSRRLGRPKQTIVFEGEMLVGRAARIAAEAGLSPVLIVVSPEADFCAALEAAGHRCVVNEEAAEGMAASIRCGIRAAERSAVMGAVLMTCDQPHVTVEHLRRLVAEGDAIRASEYAGRKGIPAYFPAAVFDDLLKLQGDAGAREMLRDAAAVLDESLGMDVDTAEDVAGLRG